MIKYEDIIKRIANIEKKKIKNEERIKLLSEENNTLTVNLKLLNQKKSVMPVTMMISIQRQEKIIYHSNPAIAETGTCNHWYSEFHVGME